MAPQWSYQLGLENGWMPTDPRAADGQCGNTNPFVGGLKPHQTGGEGAGQIPQSVSVQFPWPPVSLADGGAVTALPSYTPTGTVAKLPGPTFLYAASQATSTIVGNNWMNAGDNAGMMVPVAGCSYLDPWIGEGDVPAPLCSAAVDAALAKRYAEPLITPAPV